MDFKVLKNRILAKSPALKEALLNIAEEELQIVVSESIDFFSEELLKSSSPIFKGLGGMLPVAKIPLQQAIDALDGKKG